jgi:hypothetical protein
MFFESLMATLLAQIAPQRSTQYSSLTETLAPFEIELSPIGNHLTSIEPVIFAGQNYLKCELDAEPTDEQIKEFGLFAMTSAWFSYFDKLAEFDGPFLRPIETNFSPLFPTDLITTRRYSGKTNELLTHFMCNLARFSSEFSDHPWTKLRLFDPLAGGGTTLFVALVLGADVAGLEVNKKSAQSTAVFLKQYAQEKGIPFTFKEERLKKLKAGRWWFTLGDDPQKRCILAKGEIAQAPELISGFKKPHFIVADLPYGIQHGGPLDELLTEALPVWEDLLLPGGTLVYSWDATRFQRSDMINVLESVSNFIVLNESPYDQLGHRVDRVIKNRDIIVARK